VSAFTNGIAFICGGARTVYAGCTAKSTGNLCTRNADCVTTVGGSSWCTGPKIPTCFVYDRYLTRNWIKSALSLITARAYAASVVLPDGHVWVLGGAGSTNVLQSTELIEILNNDISKITAGPDLQEPLMGHCVAVASTSQVMVIGGYSTVINDYSPTARIYDFNTKQWITDIWMGTGSRMDSSCRSVNIEGIQKVLMVGGWNNLALTDTAVYSKFDGKWIFYNGTGTSTTPLPLPLRSSALIERDQNSIVLGGVSCDSAGRSCKQTNKSNYVDHLLIFRILGIFSKL
jgi:hypothetical protein